MNPKKNSILLLIVFLSGLLIFTVSARAQESLIRAGGTLTSVEANGAVTIDGRNYIVSPSARITDWRDYSVSLEQLVVPNRVYFEYISTSEGRVISLMKEIVG